MKKTDFSRLFERMDGHSWGAVVCVFIGLMTVSAGAAIKNPSVAAIGGAFVAVAGSLFGLWTQSRKEKIDTSKYYADAAVAGMKQALELMSEPKRTRWVAASETLRHVAEMYLRITEPEHRSVFRMNHASLRLQIGEQLGYKQDEPWIYFGKKTTRGPSALYFAAQESTPHPGHPAHGIGGEGATKWIPMDRLAEIYDFVHASETQPDKKLKSLKDRGNFSPSEMHELELLYPGLHKYVQMHMVFHFQGGQIFRNSDGSKVGIHDEDFENIVDPPR